MQNAGIAALGLNWRYLACDVHPGDLRAAIQGAKAMKFIGLNLTVPHKLLALDMVDELDRSAQDWGAVNTIRFQARDAKGEWQPVAHFAGDVPGEIHARGFNTDAEAFARSLREDLGLQHWRHTDVLLLGAGGAGRVAALKFAFDGVGRLFLVNRTAAKAEEIAVEIRRRFPRQEVKVGYPNGQVGLVVNATSLGLNPQDNLPFNPEQYSLAEARAVYDMIYRPAETPLLEAARAAGCRVANGLGMLLYQGAQALEIWSGMSAPIDLMRRALEKEVYGR
ncbi:MAG: shikimate dehydrogenase [Verrucomicrobia bacterium]|nr:MAG: shikimate dehydrogenase [Verrucomicrobiota bacterium]